MIYLLTLKSENIQTEVEPMDGTMGGTAVKEPFFTRDSGFYKTLFRMLLVVALQNLVAYSVNMADNMMLGVYSQTALSAAATVNQVFFMVQQFK